MLTELIRKGPICVTPPAAEGANYLVDSGFRIGRFVLGDDPDEEITLYRPATDYGTALLLPVVRHFVHDFAADRRTDFARQPIFWPQVKAAYYQLTPGEMHNLDARVKDLQVAIRSLPMRDYGLELDSWYGFFQEIEFRDEPPTRLQQTSYRVAIDAGPSIELQFMAHELPGLVEPWNRVWQLLEGVCDKAHELPFFEEDWDIEAHDLAERLSSPRTPSTPERTGSADWEASGGPAH